MAGDPVGPWGNSRRGGTPVAQAVDRFLNLPDVREFLGASRKVRAGSACARTSAGEHCNRQALLHCVKRASVVQPRVVNARWHGGAVLAPAQGVYASCNDVVRAIMGADVMQSVAHLVPDLLNHIHVLLYQGRSARTRCQQALSRGFGGARAQPRVSLGCSAV